MEFVRIATVLATNFAGITRIYGLSYRKDLILSLPFLTGHSSCAAASSIGSPWMSRRLKRLVLTSHFVGSIAPNNSFKPNPLRGPA